MSQYIKLTLWTVCIIIIIAYGVLKYHSKIHHVEVDLLWSEATENANFAICFDGAEQGMRYLEDEIVNEKPYKRIAYYEVTKSGEEKDLLYISWNQDQGGKAVAVIIDSKIPYTLNQKGSYSFRVVQDETGKILTLPDQFKKGKQLLTVIKED